MKQKLQTSILFMLIFFMPIMMYVHFEYTKVNVSIADIMLIPMTIVFLINIKEFFRNQQWIYLLYFIGLLVSLLISQWVSMRDDVFHHVSTSVMMMEMIKTLVVAAYFFSALVFVQHEKIYRWTWNVVSLSSIPVMMIGFSAYLYFLQGKPFPITVFEINSLRFLGTFEDPNLVALYFIFVFFVSLRNCIFIQNRFLRGMMIGISGLSLIVIFLTMSRGGWVALAAGLLVFVIINWKYITKKAWLWALLIILLTLLSINIDLTIQGGAMTNNVVNRIHGSLSSGLESIDRVKLTKTAIQMGNNNFLTGVGKGSFHLNTYHYLGEDSKIVKNQYIPHNTLAGIYAQQGILGLLIFISLPGYLLYLMIRSRKRENYFLIPLFIAILIHSMSINLENVRFIWYFFGLILVSELRGFSIKAISSVQLTFKMFAIILTGLVVVTTVLYIDVARKWTIPIYVHNGDNYEKQVKGFEPGNYLLTFDVQSDVHRHQVDVYDDETLIESKQLESAKGVFHLPVQIEDELSVVFRSHEEGWMRVYNAYAIKDNQSIPLYNYVLLPDWAEGILQRQGWLKHSSKTPSLKNEVAINEDVLDIMKIFNARVIRHSNLSHMFEFDMQLEKSVSKDYELFLLMDYASISELLPTEDQRNHRIYGFTIFPLTSNWKPGNQFTVRSNALLSSVKFKLYGRYRSRQDQTYLQESYFPIPYDVVNKSQALVPLGNTKLIHVQYSKNEEDRIVMTHNGWVESPRMNLKAGSYEITFKAQGSYYKGFSKIRIRDSSLQTVAELTLDDTMKEYTVDYYTDEDLQGASFVLELINYAAETDVGNRIVYLDDTLNVVRK